MGAQAEGLRLCWYLRNSGDHRSLHPIDPLRIGNLGPLGACVDAITGDGGYLYVATNGSDTRVRIYSLAEPSAPVLIGSEPGNSTYSRWTGNIAVFGDRLYVGQTDGNRVYDIADRTSPRYLRELSGEDRYFEGTFAVDRGLLYVADWENLDVWSLASPSAPTLLRGIPGGPGHQVKQAAAFQGRSLAARTHALSFADTETGSVQNILSPTPGVGYVGTMAETNGLLYMGTGPGIAVISLSSPTEPSLVHEMYARWSADMKVEGGFLYNLSAWGFLEVYSLATPSQPSLIAEYPVTGGLDALRLDVTANRLAVVGGDQVRFFERFPNGTLIEGSVRSLPTFGNGVTLKDSTAYVALGNGSLQVWSVADLTNPVLLSTLLVLDHQPEREAFSADAEVEGDRLHLLYGRHGYALMNIAVPQAPVALGTYETFEFEGSSVQPSGNVVYLATFGWNGRDGLSALNISDPSNITVSSSIRATGLVRDVIAASGYVYTAESEGCLRVRNPVQGSTTNNVFGGFIIH